MFNLTEEESKESARLSKKLSNWILYCEEQRNKEKKTKILHPIDKSLDLTNNEYYRLDELGFKFFDKNHQYIQSYFEKENQNEQ